MQWIPRLIALHRKHLHEFRDAIHHEMDAPDILPAGGCEGFAWSDWSDGTAGQLAVGKVVLRDDL